METEDLIASGVSPLIKLLEESGADQLNLIARAEDGSPLSGVFVTTDPWLVNLLLATVAEWEVEE